MEDSEQKHTDTQIPDMIHLEELKKLKSLHPQISNILEKYTAILERHIDPIKESMQNSIRVRKRMSEEMEDKYYGGFYDNIPLIKDKIPNFREAQLDFNTKVERQKSDLYKFINELINESNNIQEKVVEAPPPEKTNMSEADKKAFKNKQQDDMMLLLDKKKVPNKAQFNLIKNNILKRAGTDEEKLTYTDNISREMFGIKMEDVEWMIGKRKKTMS